MFTTDRVGEVMKSAMDPKQAKDWFGTVPPDLTLVALFPSLFAQAFGPGWQAAAAPPVADPIR